MAFGNAGAEIWNLRGEGTAVTEALQVWAGVTVTCPVLGLKRVQSCGGRSLKGLVDLPQRLDPCPQSAGGLGEFCRCALHCSTG